MSRQQSISQLAKLLEQYWAGRAVGGSAAGAAGAGVTDHHQLAGLKRDDHPHYLTAARGNSLYVQIGQNNDVNVTGGLGIDVTGGNVINVDLVDTDPYLEFVDGDLQAKWTADGSVDFEHLLTVDDAGATKVAGLEATSKITTPEIAANDNLLLNPVGYIHTEKVLRSTGYDPGLAGAMINFNTGDADVRNLEVSSLIADTFIARAKYANVQGEWWGKSASQTTRPFKIPVAGTSETFYIADIPGLSGFQAFEDGDFLYLPFMEFEAEIQSQPIYLGTDFASAKLSDASAGPASHYDNNFEGDTVGQPLTDWYSTDSNAPDSELPTLFTVLDDAGNNTYGTASDISNGGTDFSGADHQTLNNYTFSGRFKKETAAAAIGFKLYSQYWPGGEDGYYRIRQYAGHPTFEASHHGDAQISGGVSQSSFTPTAGTWYRFKIEIETVTGQVNLRGRFWEDGAQEPATWDIDCWDSSSSRYTQGTFGIWNYGSDYKYYDDLLVESTDGGSGLSSTLVFDTSAYPVGTRLAIAGQIPTDRSGLTLPSGWNNIIWNDITDDRFLVYRIKGAGDSETVNITVTEPTRDIFGTLIAVQDAASEFFYSLIENENTYSPTGNWLDSNSMAAINIGTGTSTFPSITNLSLRDSQSYDFDNGYASDSNSSSFWQSTPEGPAESYTVAKASTIGEHFTVLFGFKGLPTSTTQAAIGQACGQITRIYPGDLDDEEQAYNWTTVVNSPGQGITASADLRVVDMGVSGQGYVEVSTVGSSQPWMRTATWTGTDPINGTHTTTAIMGNVSGLTGNAQPEYGFWAGEEDKYISATDTVFETRNLPFKSYGTDGKLKVSVSAAGNVAYGRDVEAGVRGFYYNQASGNVTIGDPTGDRVHWEQDANGSGGVLTVTGSLTIAPGTAVPWSDVTGPYDDIFNADVVWDDLGTSRPSDDELLNDRQVWDDVQDLPPILGYTDVQDPPGGLDAGLYMNSWYMGYWSPTQGWQTYMQNNGNFMFRAANSTNNRLEWDGTKLAGYDSGDVTQFYLSATDGKAYAGGGVVQMDADGLRIQNGYGENNRISFYSTTDSNSEFATIKAEGNQSSGFVSFGVNNASGTALRINYHEPTGNTGVYLGPVTGYVNVETPLMFVSGNIQSNGSVISDDLLQAYDGLFLDIDTLPTADPGFRGYVWRDGSQLRISLG